MDAEKITDWHAQFAPQPAPKDVQPVDEASRAATVEHPAGEDGVFAAPAPKAEDLAEAAPESEKAH